MGSDLFKPKLPEWKVVEGGLRREEILPLATEEARKTAGSAVVVVAPLKIGDEKFGFDRDSVEFAKMVGGIEHNIAVAWNEENHSTHYHADELWIRGLIVVGELGLSILAGLITTYLTKRLGKKKSEATVHFEVSVEEHNRTTRITYNGPAGELMADANSGKLVARLPKGAKEPRSK